ncbi:hypothetical protein [Methylobacterium sp. ID0610]|uniref:hypothetical protein n=1 Tax=Methylobacterium carpenticola TaxID=3344827 RepID=UPI0036864EEC
MDPKPFRIDRPSSIVVNSAGGAQTLSDYVNRLIILIPGEALGAYLTIRGIWLGPNLSTNPLTGADKLIDYLPAVGIVLCLVSRIWGTRDATGSLASVQWLGTGLAVIAFVLWVFAMGHRPFGLELDGRITSSLIVVFSFIVPYIYKGE